MAVVETALDWDYVIVGSGAGGGVLAARLAEAGMRVFLIEAGGDPQQAQRMPDDCAVPAFHAFACENPALAWDFHVRHYQDEAQQARDPKYRAGLGVLYPRAAALGGCTVHNAMIFMPPHDADWNEIARMTGDVSWRAEHMRRYLHRIENCGHRPVWRALRHIGLDPTGHGWNGWLRTEKSMPLSVLRDDGLLRLVLGTAGTFTRKLPTPLLSAWRWLRSGLGDPNSRRKSGSFEGICYTPLATRGHRRHGVRERLLEVARRYPDRLHIELDALATRVLFDAQGAASGVEYLRGARLYRAHPSPSTQAGERHEVHAQREVILCGGAFNTPQLLMLSGIGPARDLRAHGIDVQVDLPGVGHNLQDRYEVALTHRMRRPWEVLQGARWERDDTLWQRWKLAGRGMYGSNGAAVGVVSRSSGAATPEPDLFCMALLARFEGYFRGFSDWIRGHDDQLTWAVLKGRTRNRAGSVRLRSANPLDAPLIHFAQFEEGSPGAQEDLRAMVEAIRSLRALTAPLLESGWIAEEVLPGAAVQSDEALARFVRDTAWGHHASCTCPIGPREQGGVLDSTLSVYGVSRLRVVDASAFPRIPGFFIAAAIFMLAEKAADMVLHTARNEPPTTVR